MREKQVGTVKIIGSLGFFAALPGFMLKMEAFFFPQENHLIIYFLAEP